MLKFLFILLGIILVAGAIMGVKTKELMDEERDEDEERAGVGEVLFGWAIIIGVLIFIFAR